MKHWWDEEAKRGPKSELARYAFGYSDKKPGWTYWGIIAAMVLVIVLLAACSPNLLDGKSYRHLLSINPPCHPDGSVILAQEANSTGNFSNLRTTERTDLCSRADDFGTWTILHQSEEAKTKRQQRGKSNGKEKRG